MSGADLARNVTEMVSETASGPAEPLVLVLNAGSSSLKARVLDAADRCLWMGQTNWQTIASASQASASQAFSASPEPLSGANKAAAEALRDWLLPAIAPWSDRLALVGHRVVHGGTAFTAPTCLTPSVRRDLAALVPLAPLHNGPALAVMDAIDAWQPALPQWACFDTAFHHTLPPEAYTYALPQSWREQGLRRFGFHGLNHQHVSEVVARQWAAKRAASASPGPTGSGPTGPDPTGPGPTGLRLTGPTSTNPLRLISCHLGAGCSLCAIHNGRSIDTTMGFTPLEGLVMATRSGSVDPGLLLHLLRQGVTPERLDQDLHHQSGLLGLSDGLSGSMKELRQAAAAGDGPAARAIAVFRQALLRGIGAMAASLGGVDVIALTGGIGEHDDALRDELAAALTWLPSVALQVVNADEEGLIARQCRAAAAAATDSTAADR